MFPQTVGAGTNVQNCVSLIDIGYALLVIADDRFFCQWVVLAADLARRSADEVFFTHEDGAYALEYGELLVEVGNEFFEEGVQFLFGRLMPQLLGDVLHGR